MRQARRLHDTRFPEDDQAAENRVTSSLASLAVLLAIVTAGLFLIRHLQDKAAVEDCLMAQRLNCDAILAEVDYRPGHHRISGGTN